MFRDALVLSLLLLLLLIFSILIIDLYYEPLRSRPILGVRLADLLAIPYILLLAYLVYKVGVHLTNRRCRSASRVGGSS